VMTLRSNCCSQHGAAKITISHALTSPYDSSTDSCSIPPPQDVAHFCGDIRTPETPSLCSQTCWPEDQRCSSSSMPSDHDTKHTGRLSKLLSPPHHNHTRSQTQLPPSPSVHPYDTAGILPDSMHSCTSVSTAPSIPIAPQLPDHCSHSTPPSMWPPPAGETGCRPSLSQILISTPENPQKSINASTHSSNPDSTNPHRNPKLD